MLLFVCLVLLELAARPALGLTDKEIAAFTSREIIEDDQTDRNRLKSQLFAVDNEDGSITVTTNGVPWHAVGEFPNPMMESWNSFTMFKEPVMRPEGKELTCLPSGPIGISVSGAYIHSWWSTSEKGCFYAADTDEFDVCGGSTTSDNQYHYHQYSPCVSMPICRNESPIFGVALDGIPIFGPIADNGRQLTRIDVDKCGGRYDKNGRYKYHVTIDPPYFPSCFRGELRKDVGIPAADLTCTCPYDDSKLETGGGAEICDFTGDVNVPAACEDKIAHNATISRKWRQEQRYIKLAACCPAGKDCGTSCETEKGTKEECQVDTRKVGVFVNLPKEVSCWEACYVECITTDACNCKRKCRRECVGRNGASDGRKKRDLEREIRRKTGKLEKCRSKNRKNV